MPFKSENQLSSIFLQSMDGILQPLHKDGIFIKAEVRAPGGIPDYILYRYIPESLHYLIAIEFKLSDWYKALKQAFKYRNFSNEVYVVMDKERAATAINNINLFKSANVGFITFNTQRQIEILNFPTPSIPFSIDFAYDVASEIIDYKENVIRDMPFLRTTRGGIALSHLRNI